MFHYSTGPDLVGFMFLVFLPDSVDSVLFRVINGKYTLSDNYLKKDVFKITYHDTIYYKGSMQMTPFGKNHQNTNNQLHPSKESDGG